LNGFQVLTVNQVAAAVLSRWKALAGNPISYAAVGHARDLGRLGCCQPLI
jgi:hypothetical protein